MARFAVVTTCKGRLEHVRRTLPTLTALADCAVVLVDYDCPDGVGAWVRQAHPEVKVVEVRERPLFNLSEARNLGAAAADAPWLLFLDADTLAAPDLTAQLSPLLEPGVFLQPDPRPPDLWGALAVSRADFDAVGGYDEVFEGWGAEDVDMVVRLQIAGRRHRSFPGALLAGLPHGDDQRTRFHAIRDRRLSVGVNSLYRMVKADLLRLEVTLDFETRRRLYADVRAAATAPGGPQPLKVSFRQTEHGGHRVLSSLIYEFKDVQAPLTPA
jgi:glycosyltransferase involved in cell wall biosynthesis